MLSILRLLLCVLAGASAYELPALAGRRAVLARVAAAVPFAAISAVSAAERTNTNAALGAKWMEAASSNTVLGVAKAEKIGSEPEGGISIGRNAFVDEAGVSCGHHALHSAMVHMGKSKQPLSTSTLSLCAQIPSCAGCAPAYGQVLDR